MSESNLRPVEKKVLGAMLLLANDDNIVESGLKGIAHKMGYKSGGGIISYALQSLEMKNHITKLDKSRWKVFI